MAAVLPCPPLAAFTPGELTIEGANGRHRLTIELALTPAERAQGLMFRREMAPDHGMLFDFGEEHVVSMWMKNTILPLDMVFIDAQGRIAHIATDTVPFSEAIVSSEKPVRAVLEVLAGTARRLGIKVGDRVLHPMFGRAASG